MTRKSLLALLSILLLSACTTTDLQRTLGTILSGPLSQEDVAAGLKEALRIGIRKGADELSEPGGYFESPYKILLPPEARKITDRLQNVPGFNRLEQTVLEKINRGAEDAAKRAAPIFVEAIRSMTIRDAMDILMGADNAATEYLKRTTYEQLYQEFNPVIINSLDKFDARTVWADAVNTYNKIPLVEDADPDLDDYVTRQALDGLFDKVAAEENNIRENVAARTTDLLRRVFAAQDNR